MLVIVMAKTVSGPPLHSKREQRKSKSWEDTSEGTGFILTDKVFKARCVRFKQDQKICEQEALKLSKHSFEGQQNICVSKHDLIFLCEGSTVKLRNPAPK
ncbi:hypothetical protein CHARACLAT_001170 [Characodon lateralis]|uniref:Uncharacterized protein n=1 Tax=Characodon lateralis TaxID=208331 RepID=A0ABU7F0Q3_9TELE|nr:hypothetical protein [Characodon lateralis]